jgi:hypothetical protein
MRARAKAEARATGMAAFGDLDQCDVVRIARPPRKVRIYDFFGRPRYSRRDDLYDWLEYGIDDREMSRLRRWFTDPGRFNSPDQCTMNICAYLDQDLSVDDAMNWWVHKTAVADGIGYLVRGFRPSGTSGRELCPEMERDGWDTEQICCELNPLAVQYIAERKAQLDEEEAELRALAELPREHVEITLHEEF